MSIDHSSRLKGAGNDGYRIERRMECVLVYGPVPLSDFEGLFKLASKSAVLDPSLASSLGATVVFGESDHLDLLKSSLKQELMAATRRRYGSDLDRLDESDIQWLASGERGLSSETIFQSIHGITILAPHELTTPRDPADLRRCRLLLEQSPVIAEQFHSVMSRVSGWGALVAHWEDLCALMDDEAPQWRDGKKSHSCPRTYQKMKTLADLALKATS
jgi:hypothetical protein|nr:hypothetical protein 3 [Prochloraceae cyanobacterium]BDD46471.1 hypothetical protein 16 [bacterium]